MVSGCPTLPEVAEGILHRLEGCFCVCHTHFDRVSLARALTRYQLASPALTWLDTARVTRRAWRDCASRGYGLADVCRRIGYTFAHHDALEDAKAAGQILLAAIAETGLEVRDWLVRVEQPIDPDRSASGSAIRRDGDPEGPLHGEVVVFTGALSVPRSQAADLAAGVGCDVVTGVSSRATILVVGNQDARKLAGKEKSAKHLKAERLITGGQELRIIRESDFLELVRASGQQMSSP